MICSACSAEIPTGLKFCVTCGGRPLRRRSGPLDGSRGLGTVEPARHPRRRNQLRLRPRPAPRRPAPRPPTPMGPSISARAARIPTPRWRRPARRSRRGAGQRLDASRVLARPRARRMRGPRRPPPPVDRHGRSRAHAPRGSDRGAGSRRRRPVRRGTVAGGRTGPREVAAVVVRALPIWPPPGAPLPTGRIRAPAGAAAVVVRAHRSGRPRGPAPHQWVRRALRRRRRGPSPPIWPPPGAPLGTSGYEAPPPLAPAAAAGPSGPPLTVVTELPPDEPEAPSGTVDPHQIGPSVVRLVPRGRCARGGSRSGSWPRSSSRQGELVEALVQGVYQTSRRRACPDRPAGAARQRSRVGARCPLDRRSRRSCSCRAGRTIARRR